MGDYLSCGLVATRSGSGLAAKRAVHPGEVWKVLSPTPFLGVIRMDSRLLYYSCK